MVKSESQEKIDSLQAIVATTRENIEIVKAQASAQIDSMRGLLKTTTASVKKMEDSNSKTNARADRINKLTKGGFAALESCWQRQLKGLPEADDQLTYILGILEHLQNTLTQYVNRNCAGLPDNEVGLVKEMLQKRIIFTYNAKCCQMIEALGQ